jgi:hypothetical protein
MDTLKDIKNIVFISDVDYAHNSAVHENIKSLTQVTQYSSLFANRNLDDLSNRAIDKIWINIKDKQALTWLKLYVLTKKRDQRQFNVFAVYSKVGGEHQKWVADVKADVVVEYEKIAEIRSLNFADFVTEIVAQGIDVAKPVVHRLLGCLFADRVTKN